jgi:hypothetical protein
LFEEIRQHASSIQFAVDFSDVWKIYRWSNPYLHAGWRDFVWVAGYVLQFLRPLFAGRKPDPSDGWSIDSGIQMHRETWHAIRASFAKEGSERGLQLNDAAEALATCVFLD